MANMNAVPELSFRTFFTYQEVTDFVNSLASVRPDLCRLGSLGKSRDGRDIHLLTVTDYESGPPEDKPGYLANMLAPLKDNGLNVVHMYAYVGFSSGKAVMIFRFNDIDKAIGVIEANGYKILDAEAFGILSQS